MLSPWLWGLHTRRLQHVQLLREDLVDATGAEFDPARRRAFPIRSWAARRWSIDHHVRDPHTAWDSYNAERAARQAERRARRRAQPASRLRAVVAVLRGHPVHPVPPIDLQRPPPTDGVVRGTIPHIVARTSRPGRPGRTAGGP